MVEAATGFRKSGFSDEDAANLALVATMYQNVADESISAADSAGFIIAQMKAFNIEAEDATHIIDAVNEVSNNYAVSSSDLANNLGKVSSALAVGGNSFEEVLGMMTAITEITRNSSTAARGLVSVQSRFNQIIDETSSTGKKLTDFYDKHGIAIKDQNGQLRNLYDVLKDTAGIWDTLDENEQKYFLNIQAGANQTRNLAALMENFGVAIDATATAMNSAGSAAEENGRVMESLQKKIDNLRAAWENFSTNTITKDFIGNIIDAGTQLLTFANTDLGQATVKALLFGTTIGSATGFIGTFVGKIFELATEMKKLGSVVDGPTTAIGRFLALGTKGKWTLIALGIAGITAALVLLHEALESGTDKFDKFMSKSSDFATKNEELQTKIKSAEDELKKLNDVPYADRSQEQNEEIARLENIIQGYKDAAAAAEVASQEAAKKALSGLRSGGVEVGATITGAKTGSISDYQAGFGIGSIEEYTGLTPTQIQALTASYGSYEEALYRVSTAFGITQKAGESNEAFMRRADTALRSQDVFLGTLTQDWESYITSQSDALKSSAAEISKNDKLTTSQLRQTQNLIDSTTEYYNRLKQVPYDQLLPIEKQFIDNYDRTSSALATAKESTDKFSAALRTLGDFTDGMPEKFASTEQSLSQLAQSLIRNSDLGIQSAEDLKSVLLNLADAGYIDFSNIEGGIDAFIQRLMEVEGFDFSPKTVDIATDDDDAIQGIDEVASELESIPENIVANISTTSDAEAMTGALNNLNDAIDKLQGKSVDVTIGAKTDNAITALDSLRSQIESTATDVDINAVGNDMVTPMLNQINSLAAAVPKNIQITVRANISSALANLRTISNYTIPNKSFSVVCSGASVAIQNLATIKHGLDQLQDKTITVTVNYKKTGNYATGTESAPGGLALINDGAPVNGSAGELVVHDGVGQIYNDGKETVQPIPKGAKIYTARQTQDILKDRGLTVDDVAENPIPAMANGTNNNKYPDYRLDPNYSGVTTLSGSGEDLKKNFDEWLKEKKHFLNMDVITEAQYYRDLEIMNERYLKNMADYRDDYWQHEEEIYNWRNQSLEEQIALEEKLEELAKAKTQKVLTYTGGRSQYLQNIEAIAAAQREVDKITGKYADGTMGARGGLSLVGEEGPELRVLKNGDGIIPADATKNLLSLSRFSAKDIIGAAKSNIMQYAFNISNLSLPNVHSPEDFIDGLRNMAYQYSFSRT